MSYNGSGTFQINTSGQPVVAGTVISSTAFNALTADLATGLSTAITKDGQTTTTARIPFAAGINSSSATDSTSTATGSIITAGGVGVAKAVFIGTTLNVASTTTLTGVATLTANPVLSAGTANGVTYLNGSKSLTSGSAITFDGTNFATTGTATATKLIPTGSSVTGNGMYLPAANSVGISTNGTNAVYIDASQNVGIGVTPSAWSISKAFEVGSLGTALWSSGAGSASISAGAYFNSGWKYANATSKPSLIDIDNAGKISLSTTTATGTAGNAVSFTQVVAVEAGKSLALQGATSQTGAGITFPATQSASTDVNTLDDYEEGSWTPSVGGTATYTTQLGRYTKIGNKVFIEGVIAINTIGTGSVGDISGLPFTTNASSPLGSISVGFYSVSATSITYISATLAASQNNINLRVAGNAGGSMGSVTFFQNSATIYFTGQYTA